MCDKKGNKDKEESSSKKKLLGSFKKIPATKIVALLVIGIKEVKAACY